MVFHELPSRNSMAYCTRAPTSEPKAVTPAGSAGPT